jgi:hypothetical protein
MGLFFNKDFNISKHAKGRWNDMLGVIGSDFKNLIDPNPIFFDPLTIINVTPKNPLEKCWDDIKQSVKNSYKHSGTCGPIDHLYLLSVTAITIVIAPIYHVVVLGLNALHDLVVKAVEPSEGRSQ